MLIVTTQNTLYHTELKHYNNYSVRKLGLQTAISEVSGLGKFRDKYTLPYLYALKIHSRFK